MNLWTGLLLTAPTVKGMFWSLTEHRRECCILSVFLFARFISLSLPEPDPPPCARPLCLALALSQKLKNFSLKKVECNHRFLFQMLKNHNSYLPRLSPQPGNCGVTKPLDKSRTILRLHERSGRLALPAPGWPKGLPIWRSCFFFWGPSDWAATVWALIP